MSDDHAAHAISAYRSRINETPHLDRIAQGGMWFDSVLCMHSETPADWPQSMYYRYWMHNDSSHSCPAHYGVRTRTHKLICYGQPGTEAMTADLRAELERIQAEVGDTHY